MNEDDQQRKSHDENEDQHRAEDIQEIVERDDDRSKCQKRMITPHLQLISKKITESKQNLIERRVG